MRTQYRKSARSPIAGVVLAVACAAGMAVSSEWNPAASASPIAAPTAPPSERAQHGNAGTARLDIRPGRARCPACGVIGSPRKTGNPGGGSDSDRCVDNTDPAAVTTAGNPGAENADLLLFLDWHMNASNGYGFGLDGIYCSAQAAMTAPIPIEASEAYEALARFRDGSGQGFTETSLSIPQQGEPAKVFPKVAH